MKKRRDSLELLRFLAAVAIMNFHFDSFLGVKNNYTELVPILVEYFFMLTGFFMMKTVSQRQNESIVEAVPYVYRKAKSIYPAYLLGLSFAFVVRMITNHISDVTEMVKQLFHFKWEFFMLHMAGFVPNPEFNLDYLSPVTWYISSMMIALIPAYFLARQFGKRYSGIIAPLLAMVIYAYIMKQYQDMNVGNEYIGCILLGNVRAFAGISAGAFAFYLADIEIEKKVFQSHRKIGNVLNIFAWVSIPCIVVLSKNLSGADMMVYIFVYMLLIIQGYVNAGVITIFLNSHGTRLWNYLGRISLYIYLIHSSILFLVKEYAPESNGLVARLLCFIAALSVSMICMFLVDKVKAARKAVANTTSE